MRCAVIGFALVGCSHAADVPATTQPLEARHTTLSITDGTFAREHAIATKHTRLPFAFDATGVNGTQLMREFLGYAEQRGARYASDLSITLQMIHDNVAIECVSKVVLDDGKPRVAVADDPPADGSDTYTTTIRPWHPDQIKATVDEHDLVCEKHGHQEIVHEPKVSDRFDAAENKRYIYLDQNIVVTKTKLVWDDDCHLQPVHREVIRWAHFVAAHFEPPDWDRLAHAYADRKLIELPPECHQIATPEHMVQHVDADLSYTGPMDTTHTGDPEPPPIPVR
jgi:hypothetical protein